MGNRAGEWTSGQAADDVVSMDVCVCVHICVNTPAAVDSETVRWRHGKMDGGWMDCVGKGGRHSRFNLVVSLRRRGGGQPSDRTQPRVPKSVVGFGGFERLVGYQTGLA